MTVEGMAHTPGAFAAVSVLLQGAQVLSVTRRGNPNNLGIPGGKVNKGEKPQDAACRELLEETGVVALKTKYLYSRCTSTKPVDIFLVTEWEGVPRTIEPNVIVRWASWQELDATCCTFRYFNRALKVYLVANGFLASAV